jgi:rSAM/selenodomain-associated transferase 2
MRLSVIVPTLDEGESVAHAIRSARHADEVIVVDGGSGDDTCAIASALGARVVAAARGRGRQLARGVAAAQGDVLLFLHADTVLPDGFRSEVLTAIAGGAAWGRFDVRFDGGGLLLRLIARLISIRSRLSRVATGDQAIFVSRAAYDAVGGFPKADLFEDVELSRRLKRHGRMAVPSAPVVTSARRWRLRGAWRTTILMWTLKTAYLLGVSPARLARFYRTVR